MNRLRFAAVLLLPLALGVAAAAGEARETRTGDFLPLLRRHLSPEPWTAGAPPFADRAAWAAMAADPAAKRHLEAAAQALGEDFPMPTEEQHMEFFRSGNRKTYERIGRRISDALTNLAFAYLVTADRRYLEKWEGIAADFAKQRTWSPPPLDKTLHSYKTGEPQLDLATTNLAWTLSLCWRLLKDEMRPEPAETLRREIDRRAIQVLEDYADGKRKAHWFTRAENNWNAVCFARITGAVLAFVDDPARRLKLVSYALENIDNSLRGFAPDGYCVEGVAYWDYGYRNNLLFAHMVKQTTGGAVDLMRLESMRRPALFPERIMIQPGLFPATADSSVTVRISPNTVGLRDSLMDRPSKEWAGMYADGRWGFGEMLLFAFLRPRPAAYPETAPPEPLSLFRETGIAVMRPDRPGLRLAAMVKFGANSGNHHHNDVGAFTLALDGVPMVEDPGAEVYTARTFSKNRFESSLINSYGHPVPRIDGRLQQEGDRTRCPVGSETIEPDRFRWSADLGPAYGMEEILRLEREFTYSRTDGGRFVVHDRADFARPLPFEAVLVTRGQFKQTGPFAGEIAYRGKTLRIEVESPAPVEFAVDEIKEDTGHRNRIFRVALRLREPSGSVDFKVTLCPS